MIMRMKRVLLGAVMMVAAVGLGQDTARPRLHVVMITEDQNGQTVDVRVGDAVVVSLVAAGGTGYEWTMEPVDLPMVAFGKPESVALKPGLAGGPEDWRFPVAVKMAGTVTLRFGFARGWLKGPPEKTFVVTLVAEAADGAS